MFILLLLTTTHYVSKSARVPYIGCRGFKSVYWSEDERKRGFLTMLIRIPRGWEIPEREVTPQATYLNRRQLLAGLGLVGIGGRLIAAAASVKQNTEFNTGDRPVTEEWAATGYQ